MNGIYNLNDIAEMTGFTTRTLRNYLNQGLLKGSKSNGVWQFTAEEVGKFFSEPYVKEGLKIKRTSAVFDFLADTKKKSERSCVILDIPCELKKANALSAFFCEQMDQASDTVFSFGWDNSMARVILSGAADQIGKIMAAYSSTSFE